MVVPTAVAKGAGNGFSSSWVTLTQCEHTLLEKGREGGREGGRNGGREEWREGGMKGGMEGGRE